MHHGQRKSPTGGRRHDKAESVETPWRLAHRLRASHPDSKGVENIWSDEEKTAEGVVTRIGQRTCPRGASESGNESGGGSDAMVVEGDLVPELRENCCSGRKPEDNTDRRKADFPRTCLTWKRSWACTEIRRYAWWKSISANGVPRYSCVIKLMSSARS